MIYSLCQNCDTIAIWVEKISYIMTSVDFFVNRHGILSENWNNGTLLNLWGQNIGVLNFIWANFLLSLFYHNIYTGGLSSDLPWVPVLCWNVLNLVLRGMFFPSNMYHSMCACRLLMVWGSMTLQNKIKHSNTPQKMA